jgi:hypothetical protein
MARLENRQRKTRRFKNLEIVKRINIRNWGYRARYEPTLEKSIKKRKYDQQSFEEKINDVPRLITNNHARFYMDYEIQEPEKMDNLYLTILDHARTPGTFDYTLPQTYHAFLPDIEQDAYVEVGGNRHRKLAISDFSA